MDNGAVQCGRCGAKLAVADEVCVACGEAVPQGLRVALLAKRAQTFADDENYGQAVRSAEALLALSLEPKLAKIWWRKLAAWLQRLGRPEAFEAAEIALMRSVRLDDGDDLSHQLWVDLLQRRGRLETARQYYKGRLGLDPDDAVAARHLASLRLMEDLKLSAPPKLELEPAKRGLLLQALWPTPYKMIGAGIGLLSCLYMLFAAYTGGSGAPVLPDGAESMGSIMKLAEDPVLNGVQILIYGGYLVWGYRERRGA